MTYLKSDTLRSMPVTLHDALVVPILCGEAGIPFIGMELLAALAPVEGDLARVVAHEAALYRGTASAVAMRIVEVERILDANGLPHLPRPTIYEEYTQWADAACRAVLAATGPAAPEGAVAAFARALVQVLQPIELGAMVLRLRSVAPTHETLRIQDEHLLERLREGVRQLTAMSTFSTLPDRVRPKAEQLATVAPLSLLLDRTKVEIAASGLLVIHRKMTDLAETLTVALCT